MTLHVDPIEAFWFLVNATAFVLTTFAVGDARRDLLLAQVDDDPRHEARELTAKGNLRRESLRLVMQALFISLVIPGLFIDRPVVLSPALVTLMAVPVVLLIQTLLDAQLRGRLSELLLALVRTDRATLALESSVQANIELTKEGISHAETAAKKADAAYHEANTLNLKIAKLTEIVGGKEDKP